MDRVGGRWHLLPDGGAHFSRAVTAQGDLTYSQRGNWCLQPGGLSDRQELRRGTRAPRTPGTPDRSQGWEPSRVVLGVL